MKSFFAFSSALAWGFCAFAQEPVLQSSDLPRVPATPPERALNTFQLRDGFRLELAAAEPLVADPITMAFDEDARLYVIEMGDYSERRDESLGRVRLLEDTDGDGKFDRSHVFADGLAWPTAIFPWDGGVFVGATPSIFYLKDSDGDGRADIKKEVFTGFDSGVARLNVQQLLNSFNWSFDNRIHGANGGNSGVVTQRDGSKLNLGNYDFSFDPRTMLMRLESGGGQYGLSFNSHGHKFVCSNSSHIRQVMYEARYVTSQLSYNLPPPSVDIPVDGGAAEVFRISPDEPWRVIRTRWRVAGVVSGIVEGGGRPSGYFTGATGATIYKGDAFGSEFENNAFIGDAGGNLVHRKTLIGQGIPYQAVRASDEAQREFLASTDNWFRPVHFANAPDGALYVIDMYREVIEHPWSLPPNIKKHLDLNSGNDKGRIYRVVPGTYKQPKLPKLSKASGETLVSLLEHQNGWHRETAARLLYQRQDKSSIPQIKKLLSSSENPLGKVHALYALQGLSALTLGDLLQAFSDKSDLVRMHAVRLSEHAGRPGPNTELMKQYTLLASDKSPAVRYQLAWTLTKFPAKWSSTILALLFNAEPKGWERHALLASSSREPLDVFFKLEPRASLETRLALAELIGVRNSPEEVKAFIQHQKSESGATAIQLMGALQTGLSKRGKSLQAPEYVKEVEAFVPAVIKIIHQAEAPPELKKPALEFVAEQENFVEIAREWLDENPTDTGSFFVSVIQRLAGKNSAEARDIVLSKWQQVPASVRPQVLQSMLSRPADWGLLLEAVQKGVIGRTEFSTAQVGALRKATDTKAKDLALAIFGHGTQAARTEVVEKFLDAARMPGNAEKGRTILEQRCLICHQFKGKGQPLGPALETVRAAGRQTLLVNILDPNREVAPRYAAYEVETKAGESFAGIVLSENAQAVTLRLPGGSQMEIASDQIGKMQPTGKSLMPEQLEEGLSKQELADLLQAIAED